MTNVINFNIYEQQPLSVTTASAAGGFTDSAAQLAADCMITNYGSAGAQVIFSATANPTAVATSGAAGTRQVYIPPGAILVVHKNGLRYFAAIADTGTTNLIMHAGSGS